jgi:acetyltransferase-like isoleucine patch superfamily enzyme
MSSFSAICHLIWSTLQNTPWKFWNEVSRVIEIPSHLLLIRLTGVQIGPGWKWYGRPIIQRHRGSTIQLGNQAELRSAPASNPLSPQHPVVLATRSADAILKIGNQVGMTGGSIVAAQKIVIGDRVVIGANTSIMDTDFHPLLASQRSLDSSAGASKPISIGDDVFIGTQSIILKGSSIGPRSVIGAGSVVSGHVPADVIAAGNPARVIKKL